MRCEPPDVDTATPEAIAIQPCKDRYTDWHAFDAGCAAAVHVLRHRDW